MAQEVIDAGLDVTPSAGVLVLFLRPDNLGVGVLLDLFFHQVVGEGTDLEQQKIAYR